MPIFPQHRIASRNDISQEIIEEYINYIIQLNKNHIGILTYSKDEDINLGKRSLQSAAD